MCPYSIINTNSHEGKKSRVPFCMVPGRNKVRVISSQCDNENHGKHLDNKTCLRICTEITSETNNVMQEDVDILNLLQNIYITTENKWKDIKVSRVLDDLKLTFDNITHIDGKSISSKNEKVKLKTIFDGVSSKAEVIISDFLEPTEETKEIVRKKKIENAKKEKFIIRNLDRLQTRYHF